MSHELTDFSLQIDEQFDMDDIIKEDLWINLLEIFK